MLNNAKMLLQSFFKEYAEKIEKKISSSHSFEAMDETAEFKPFKKLKFIERIIQYINKP